METKTGPLAFTSNSEPHISPATLDDLTFTEPVVIYDVEKEDRAWLFTAGVIGSSAQWDTETGGFRMLRERKAFISRGSDDEFDELVIAPLLSYMNIASDNDEKITLTNARIAPVKRDFLVEGDHEKRNESVLNFARQATGTYLTELTQQLHEIGDENDWCSEFDELLDSLGLEARSREYVSSVTASFTADVDSPPSEVDEAVSRYVSDGPAVVLSSMTITGTIDVNVYWTGSRGDEENFDSSEVETAVEDTFGSSVDVIDWHVNETELSD